ncbi:hypothetical protein FVER53263_05924 [Fusarium verticillioides]|nr:hypothetical protein FVER53263_05924 [Fusarium verticillioides]
MSSIQVEEEIYDVLVIGAGPCGLAISARLHEHTPAALFTDEEHRRFHWISKYGNKMPLKHVRSGKISPPKQTAKPQYKMLVLDADSDTWMGRWNRLFKMYDISHLRSPMLWHVDPLDRDALLAHAQEARVDINVRERNDYYNPSTSLFCDHCEKVAARYNLSSNMIRKESLQHLDYDEVKGISIDGEKLFTVTTNKTRRYARTVVLAVGPANVAKIPHIPSMPDSNLPQTCHSMHITEFPDPIVKARISAKKTTNILVVGGGLTSAQLTDLAIRKGVTKVWHVMRGPLRIKHFDVGLEWMGKFKNAKQAQFYYADSDDERIEMIKEARGGGSITPVFHKRLKKHLLTKKLELFTETSLTDAQFDAEKGTWSVQTNPPTEMPAMDYMYFATGIQTDFSSLPYLQAIISKYPIEGRGGFPCINNDLMWNDDVPLFMMGRLAALRLGPAAPNLGGAQVGAERIAWAIEDRVARAGEDEGEDYRKGYLSGHGNMYSSLACTDFPLLQGDEAADLKNPVFYTISEAQHALEHLSIRIIKLVRDGNAFRLHVVDEEPQEWVLDEQAEAKQDLEAWGFAFERFRALGEQREYLTTLALITRYRLMKIWIANCFERGEMEYDLMKEDFVTIVDCARKAAEYHEVQRTTPGKFMFNVGFNPMLHFTVWKCRYLSLRVEALSLMLRLSSQQEALWDAALMYNVSRRIIEVEHGIDLAGNYDLCDETLPPDENRVKGFFFRESPEAESVMWDKNAETVYFLMAHPEGGVIYRKDYVRNKDLVLDSGQTFWM